MAKKLFGGKSSGRFSGTRGGSTPRPDPIEEDALTYLDEPAPEEPADDSPRAHHPRGGAGSDP